MRSQSCDHRSSAEYAKADATGANANELISHTQILLVSRPFVHLTGLGAGKRCPHRSAGEGANERVGQLRRRGAIERLVHADQEGVALRRGQQHAARRKPLLERGRIAAADPQPKQIRAEWEAVDGERVVLPQPANQSSDTRTA